MIDPYLTLTVMGLTRGTDLKGVCILVLANEAEHKLLPVLVSNNEYEALELALSQQRYPSVRLLLKLARHTGLHVKGIRILQPRYGRTEAFIDFEGYDGPVTISTTAAEAIITALATESPIRINRLLLQRIGSAMTDNDLNNKRMALPLSAMNDNLLEQALETAVKQENYELAGALRDELRKREEAKAQDDMQR